MESTGLSVPLAAGAGDFLAEDLFCSPPPEDLHLQILVLVRGRHSGVADVHNLARDSRKSPAKE
jgi:hypothetical protein